jgi:3-methyl-2-oxobutanoate hydroxymethyltransferase
MPTNQNSKKQTVDKEVSTSPQKVQDDGTPSSSQSREKGSSPKANRPKNPRKSKPFEESRPKHSPQKHEPRTRTTLELLKLKGKRTIVGLTAYDALLGRLVSDAGVDFILVGDSVGTTLLGHPTTIPVTIQDMIHHTAAVRRANPDCLLVADLPFGEASLSFDRLLESARSLMQQGGADAVKIEGGRDVADDIEKLVLTGIPVLGHIGLLPQTVKAIGGYRKFGSEREEAESLYTDAIALEEAGCFALVAEMVEASVASELARQILPPLIGIGSGDGCDGQILVTPDLLGLSNGSIPSFVKPKLNLNQEISRALSEYVIDVKKRKKSPSS